MDDLFKLKNYEDLEEGEPIVAFARHVVKWNRTDWPPDYGVIPATKEEAELAALAAERDKLIALCKQVVDEEYGEGITRETLAALYAAAYGSRPADSGVTLPTDTPQED